MATLNDCGATEGPNALLFLSMVIWYFIKCYTKCNFFFFWRHKRIYWSQIVCDVVPEQCQVPSFSVPFIYIVSVFSFTTYNHQCFFLYLNATKNFTTFSFFVFLLFNRQILSFWRWPLVLQSMIYSRGTSSFDLGRNLSHEVVPQTQPFFLFEMVTMSLIRWNYKRIPINWITKNSSIE